MAPVADYIRSRGLEFSLYTSIGNTTCAGRPGSAGHEATDAATFAAWGCTWLKNDNCNYPAHDPADLYGAWARAMNTLPYRLPMALKAVINYTTALTVGGASRRVGGDVSASWTDLLGLAYMAEPLWPQARAGDYATNTSSFWTDIELLQVGNGHLTQSQQSAHFWLWCAVHAPLMLSTRITALNAWQLELLTNPEALAINHDAAGLQARRVAYAPLTSAQATALPLPWPAQAFACSLADSFAPALNQAWVRVPVEGGGGGVRLVLARNSSLCLQRPRCGSDSSVVVDACSAAVCEGGLGAQWRGPGGAGNGSSSSVGALESLVSSGGCLTMEPRVSVQKCAGGGGAPYQTLTFSAGTGQVAMNFTGSGALGDYTGYPQCVDALQAERAEVWAGGLAGGAWSIVVLNPSGEAGSVSVNVSAVAEALGGAGVRALRAVRDVGARTALSNASTVFEVQVNATGARFLRVTPA